MPAIEWTKWVKERKKESNHSHTKQMMFEEKNEWQKLRTVEKEINTHKIILKKNTHLTTIYEYRKLQIQFLLAFWRWNTYEKKKEKYHAVFECTHIHTQIWETFGHTLNNLLIKMCHVVYIFLLFENKFYWNEWRNKVTTHAHTQPIIKAPQMA